MSDLQTDRQNSGAEDIGGTSRAEADAATVRATASRASEKVQSAADKFDEAAATATAKVSDLADQASAFVSKAAERAQDTYSRAAERAQAVADTVDPFVQERPYAALAIAAGIGVVVGLLMAGRGHRVIYVDNNRD